MKRIDILCPVFREEEAIHPFHQRLNSVVDKLRERYRIDILYIIDPASDGLGRDFEAARNVLDGQQAFVLGSAVSIHGLAPWRLVAMGRCRS